ncbi:MAG: carboxypeptidase-like regulatory domain-containing protein, partial [Acidobacteria bacterium]|nr:carboxypeptidase-like regulatory domain-containing protein [Acidobacteriota bacterium]
MGQIIDPSGAAVPNADIKVTNEATGVSRTTTANALGAYRVAPLVPGVYRVEVSSSGFKTSVKRGITLQVNQVARTDFSLELGEISQVTSVQGEVPVVASENASVGQVIENKKIIELPMNGRNYLDLARLTPGVAQVTGFLGGISINGGGTQSGNLMQLDGVDNFEISSGRNNILPSLDMIQEFKIQSSNYTAEQGRAGIGQVNVISRGGTNRLHGSVYEFHRNAAVSALNFFDEPRQVRKSKGLSEVPPFIRNQFGAFVGGPIKQNKTFFFGNYEGTTIRQIARGILTVPDPLIRAGDFTGRSVTIYDPLT